jgi:hypothetical protein
MASKRVKQKVKPITIEDAIGLLESDDIVIYWREGQQDAVQQQLVDLIKRLAKKAKE